MGRRRVLFRRVDLGLPVITRSLSVDRDLVSSVESHSSEQSKALIQAAERPAGLTEEVFAVSKSKWHKFYGSEVAAPPEVLFDLLSDLSNYNRWLPPSAQFSGTTDVEPYPVRLGSRYHDGKPNQPRKDWWGTVTGFQPPGSLDFHHTIHVSQLRAMVDVHIHYSFERTDATTVVHAGSSWTSTCRCCAVLYEQRSSNRSTRKICAPWRR